MLNYNAVHLKHTHTQDSGLSLDLEGNFQVWICLKYNKSTTMAILKCYRFLIEFPRINDKTFLMVFLIIQIFVFQIFIFHAPTWTKCTSSVHWFQGLCDFGLWNIHRCDINRRLECVGIFGLPRALVILQKKRNDLSSCSTSALDSEEKDTE